MKGALIGLLIGVLLLALLYTIADSHIGKGTIDIQFYDTYFVLSYSALIIFLILFLGTFFSIGGVAGSHLKSKPFWLLLAVFILCNTYFSIKLFNTFNHIATSSSATK